MAVEFDFSVDREAVDGLIRGPGRERQFLYDALATLARHPSTIGDYSYCSVNGRQHEVADLGGFIVTFWTDHAARVVLAIERT
jgi:hypothetical protein